MSLHQPPPSSARRAPAPAAAPPAAGRHALVFAGECLPGHEPAAVQRRLRAALKLDDARSARLFDGRPLVLRRDVDTATAVRRAARFAELGARLRIEPPPPDPAPPDPAPQESIAPASAAAEATTPEPTTPEAPPDQATPGTVTAPGARARRAVPGRVLAVAAVAIGGLGGVALAPHLSSWLWSGAAPAAATVERTAPAAPAPSVAAPREAPAAATPVPAQPPPASALPASPVPAVTSAPLPAPQAPPPPQSSTMPAFVRAMTGEARFEFGGPYSAAPQHRAFAISGDGAHGWTAGVPSENQARAGALERCIRKGPARDGCRVVDVNGLAQE